MFVLWDTNDVPPEHEGIIFRWSGYEEENAESLFCYVDLHRQRLRKKYLAWIYAMGEVELRGKRLIDLLTMQDGFSYWWLHKFVEKSTYIFPVADIIRLLALEEILEQYAPRRLRFVSSNQKLHLTIRHLCKQRGIQYEWVKSIEIKHALGRTWFYQQLPHFLQGLLSLLRSCRHSFSYRKMSKPTWVQSDRSVLICGYFANIEPASLSSGKFRSKYWEQLHDLMEEMGVRVNWLHHNPSESASTIHEWLFRFNQSAKNIHAIVNSYLSKRVVLAVIKNWLFLIRISLRMRKKDYRKLFSVPDSKLWLWPLLEQEWRSSLVESQLFLVYLLLPCLMRLLRICLVKS